MNQNNILEVLVFLQFVSFTVIFLEREDMKAHLKLAPLKVKAGRVFMLFLPTLTLLSILVKPLEG